MARQQGFAGSAFSAVGMAIPLLYFGGLIWYFSRVGGGSLQGIIDIGLGPTVLGLSALGLLFMIKPLLGIMRLVTGTVTGSAGAVERVDTAIAARETGDGDFDADDALARYMANRARTVAQPVGAAADPAADGTPMPSAPPPRPTFGRKTV